MTNEQDSIRDNPKKYLKTKPEFSDFTDAELQQLINQMHVKQLMKKQQRRKKKLMIEKICTL